MHAAGMLLLKIIELCCFVVGFDDLKTCSQTVIVNLVGAKMSGQIENLRLPHNMLECGTPHLPDHHCHHVLNHFHISLLTEGLYIVEELC